MKKILMLVLGLLMFCLPAFAAKGGNAPLPVSQQVQILQYPIVPCALSIPLDWTADIDDNNVMFAQKNESTGILVWANPKVVPFDSLSQLDENGKRAFMRNKQSENAQGKQNYKLDKEMFTTINERTAYVLEYSYTDPSNKPAYGKDIYVVKNRKLLLISGMCSYNIAEISSINKIMDMIGF